MSHPAPRMLLATSHSCMSVYAIHACVYVHSLIVFCAGAAASAE